MDWSDVGRVVSRGGTTWLLGEIAARRLLPDARGLALRKTKGLTRPDGPRLAKCVYHGAEGCTVEHDQRPATCNYYVCASVHEDDRAGAVSAGEAQARLAKVYAAWDAELEGEIRARHPEGVSWDEPFLTWLGARFEALAARDAGALPPDA